MDVRGALDNGQKPEEDAASEDPAEADEEEPQDYQLSRALDLLRGIALYKGRVVN